MTLSLGNSQMEPTKKQVSITKATPKWLWKWDEPESAPLSLPKSKTDQLSLKAKLANVDAERAINRAFQQELLRAKAISEAMYKSGKAARYTLISSGRQTILRLAASIKKIKTLFS